MSLNDSDATPSSPVSAWKFPNPVVLAGPETPKGVRLREYQQDLEAAIETAFEESSPVGATARLNDLDHVSWTGIVGGTATPIEEVLEIIGDARREADESAIKTKIEAGDFTAFTAPARAEAFKAKTRRLKAKAVAQEPTLTAQHLFLASAGVLTAYHYADPGLSLPVKTAVYLASIFFPVQFCLGWVASRFFIVMADFVTCS